MNPQSSITFPLGVTTYYSAKAINSNGGHARITYEHKYKRGESNILLKHNLNIISQSIGTQQTHHSNSIRITYVPRSCRAAHEVSSVKNKEGRRTSHSYWSWTHGPRETTHGSSGRRPWWWRSSRWWFSPPAGCREEFSWCSRSWKRGGGGTEMRSRKRVSVSRVSGHDINICQRGASAQARGAQAPPRRGPGGGAPPGHLGPWRPPSGCASGAW